MTATSHDVHIDQLLSNMAIDYKPEGFIADMIFPTVDVAKQSDKYAVFDRGQRLRQQNTNRAPGTLAREVTREVGSATYFCNNYALSYPVTLEDRNNADPIFVSKLYDQGAEFLLDHLMLDMEVRVATQVTNTSNVGSSSAVSSAWNGAGSPLADVNQAIDNVQYSNGIKPSDVTFGVDAWDSFRRDSTVRNLIFGTNNGGGYPSTAQVAELLGVKRVHIGGVFQNTADEGQDESLSSIWGDNVLVYARPDAPSMDRPSFAYNFLWNKPGVPKKTVERHPYNTRTKSEHIEVGYYQDEKITGASYGFLLTAVNSST